MRLSNCLNPERVFNKYTGKYQYVPCGKCEACCNVRSYGWIRRLTLESLKHPYTLFFTLTYDNDCVPSLGKTNDGLVSLPRLIRRFDNKGNLVAKYSNDGLFIPYSEVMKNSTDVERDWRYINRYHVFHFCDSYDVQLFVKRLRYYLYEFCKKTFSDEEESSIRSRSRIRYYIVSEYGYINHRPHYHGLLWFDEPAIKSKVSEFIRKAWQLCDRECIDVQFSDTNSIPYVAKYIECFADLPAVYRCRDTRPFALCSKRPFIAADFYTDEKIREIILTSKVCVSIFDSKTKKNLVTRNFRSFEDRYLPRCYGFSFLSDSARICLYKSVSKTGLYKWSQFQEYVLGLMYNSLSKPVNNLDIVFIALYKRMKQIFKDLNFLQFESVLVNSIYRIFVVSKRVERSSIELGINFDLYISKIIDYYNELDRYRLKDCLSFQQDFDKNPKEKVNVQDLDVIYQDDCLDYIDRLNNTDDFKSFKSMNLKISNDLSLNKKRKAYMRAQKLNISPKIY